MYGLESSALSIEAAWEHSQHPHQLRHTLNYSSYQNQRLQVDSPSSNQHFQFGYSAAFPQYTIPPISPVSPSTSSLSSHSSSSSSASSAEPTTAGALAGADADADYMHRAFGGFNTNSIDVDTACLPTHQLFDFDFASRLAHGGPPSPTASSSSSASSATDANGCAPPPPVTPSSPMASVPSSTIFAAADAYDIDSYPDDDDDDASHAPAPRPASAKRTAGAPAAATKKARASNSISTKDFVPPDVTGLSKREARLVKNRAAAFLSRQRKREEFELMEMYVLSSFLLR